MVRNQRPEECKRGNKKCQKCIIPCFLYVVYYTLNSIGKDTIINIGMRVRV